MLSPELAQRDAKWRLHLKNQILGANEFQA
jgi:hypothetical protein